MPRRKSGKKKRRKNFSLLKFLFRWGLVASAWAGLIVLLIITYYTITLPDLSKIDENIRQPSITLFDREGQVIATIGDLYGDYVQYKEFPPHLVAAVLSTEDRRFFSHHGIDFIGMIRAFVVNSIAGHVVQGGSTITQQLAKIVYLSHERTFKRKIQEAILALYLENKFTKEQILAMYLNRIYMGSGNYGMDAAARSYFGKRISDVNLKEAAMLAGIIKAPSRYSPIANPKLARKQAEQVLANMVDNEVLKESKVPSGRLNYNFQPKRMKVANSAPYFTDWIKEQLPDYIGQYSSGDIEVYTTLDMKLQNLADRTVAASLDSNAISHNVTQGAMVVMTPDGEVLAMTGGKSFQESQFNRATQALRQPGSAFKLFVYLAAMEAGYSPDQIMDDSPIKIKNWSPQNWDDKYLGEVTLRDAFAKSINTVAVKLAKDVGMRPITSLAYKMGITSEISNNLSSALGTSEVTLLELTGAYAHLANYGNAVWTHGVSEIKINGEVAYKRGDSGSQRIISAEGTEKMNELLMAVVNSGTGKNAQMGFDVAGKTGTSQNSRDAWFMGFTSDFVTGVWMGNDDNTPMDKVAGGNLPAIMWKNFMHIAEDGRGPRAIPVADRDKIEDGGRIQPSEDARRVWEGIVDVFGKKPPEEIQENNE